MLLGVTAHQLGQQALELASGRAPELQDGGDQEEGGQRGEHVGQAEVEAFGAQDDVEHMAADE